MPDGKELVLETLLSFCHFESAPAGSFRDNLGVPPLSSSLESCSSTPNEGVVDNNHVENGDAFVYSGSDCGDDNDDDEDDEGVDEEDAELGRQTEEDFQRRIAPKSSVIRCDGPAGGGEETESPKGGMKKKASKLLTFSQIQWIGK